MQLRNRRYFHSEAQFTLPKETEVQKHEHHTLSFKCMGFDMLVGQLKKKKSLHK